MEHTQSFSTKKRIEKYWDQCAAGYDRQFGHGIGSEAEKTLWLDLLSRNIGKDKPLTVLDVGCGTGFLSLLLAELGCRVTGIDFSATMRNAAKRKAGAWGLTAEFLPQDAEAPAFPGGTFDVVISRHVVWTLTDPPKALSNWKRLLKPGGRVVIIDGIWTPRDFLGKVRHLAVDLIRYLRGSHHHSGWKKTYVENLSDLPFFGGADIEKIFHLLRSNGFSEIHHDPMAAILDYERRQGPLEYRLAYAKNRRYLISGKKALN